MCVEYCPHCTNEVELISELKPQQCPICGMWICPCNLCDSCKGICEIENECILKNNKVIITKD